MSRRPRSNWGRWGDDDERGALNLMGPAEVVTAVGHVRHGRAVSLAQPLGASTPVPRGRDGVTHYMTRDGGDYAAGGRLLGRSRFAEDVVAMSLHAGTHVDGLAHVWYDEHLYNGHPQASVTSRGAKRCGADKLGPLVGRAVVLDLVDAHGGPLDAGEPIGAALLEASCRAQPAPGDVVLLHTGWMQSSGDRYFGGEPGLDLDGAEWLADRDVAAVGADNYAIEALEERAVDGFPVHELLLRDLGIPLLENLVLHELAATGVGECLFVANPLPVQGATAGPLAPVAIY